MLERAIPTAATSPQALVDAVYWLETTIYYEMKVHSPPLHVPIGLLKNLGLAHANLVQCRALSGAKTLPLPSYDVFKSTMEISWPSTINGMKTWQEWSTNRFLYAWGAFLQEENAKQDPQYGTIKKMFETVNTASTTSTSAKTMNK